VEVAKRKKQDINAKRNVKGQQKEKKVGNLWMGNVGLCYQTVTLGLLE